MGMMRSKELGSKIDQIDGEQQNITRGSFKPACMRDITTDVQKEMFTKDTDLFLFCYSRSTYACYQTGIYIYHQ